MTNNSDKLNTEFARLSKQLGIKLEAIHGSDQIDGGVEKIVRNLRSISWAAPTSLTPKHKVEDLRFGQLLINALCWSGHLKQLPLDMRAPHAGVHYVVTGVDLYYLENDQLEKILQDFLAEYGRNR